MLTDETIKQLNELIAEEARNEHKCRDYLKHVHHVLVDAQLIHSTTAEQEFPTQTGPNDYLIRAKVDSGIGTTENIIVVWELKAPQCLMFETDSKVRLKPSKDLVDAENKLFNHYHQLKGNRAIKEQFQLTSDSQIRMGGIIISREDKLAPGIKKSTTAEQNFRLAHTVRQQYIYKQNGMRLLSWDYILNCLQPQKISGEKAAGDGLIGVAKSGAITYTLQSSGDNRA